MARRATEGQAKVNIKAMENTFRRFRGVLLPIAVTMAFGCPVNAQILGLYSVGADGTGVKQLFKFDPKTTVTSKGLIGSPTKLALSPDGSTLAVSLIEAMHPRLFLMRLGGSSLKLEPLTDQASADSQFPTFTRDGKKILFSGSPPGVGSNLYLINLDGTHKTLFKSDASHGEYNSDGSKVVFLRGNAIFICNADGSGEEALAGAGKLDAWRPSFNPVNGTEILFAGTDVKNQAVPDPLDNKPLAVTIETVNTKHSGARILSAGFKGKIGFIFATRFSPDGQKIVFVATEPSPKAALTNLYVMNSEGSDIKKLTTAGAYTRFFEPVITPDGKKILFLGEEARH
jgi:Tol biopolymer transport system component